MKRRDFLRSAGLMTAGLSLPATSKLFASDSSLPNRRGLEITTHIEVLNPEGTTRIWAPATLLRETPYQKTISNVYKAEGGTATLIEGKADSLGIISAEFPSGVRPVLQVTSRVQTRDYSVNFAAPLKSAKADPAELSHFLRSTKLLPTDGLVKSTAQEITKGAKTDLEKTRAIYEWIVDNTFRNPKTRGCGTGDIRFMLETRDFGGKCADLNALFVGLARASGIPARDVYGIRAAKSQYGYKSLGTSSDTITKSQHCRAEVYLTDFGWVPMDPADVRKVVLEEPPGNRPLDDEMVQAARKRLFGSWEMNWVAFNFGHDVDLPGAKSGPIAFLMYPQAETSSGRLDCLDPDGFKYEITSKEIAVEGV